MTPTRITFQTDDGVRIVGTMYEAAREAAFFEDDANAQAGWAILLHAMPDTKESWDGLGRALAAAGVNALAIDARGHGESTESATGPLSYESFADADHQAKMLDIDAAARWIADVRGGRRSRIALIGASIGANLALAYAAKYAAFPAVVALSPGLTYRGITSEDKVLGMASAQRVMLVASDDDEQSFDATRELAVMRKFITLRELHGAGHGTHMLDAAPALTQEIALWIRKALH